MRKEFAFLPVAAIANPIRHGVFNCVCKNAVNDRPFSEGFACVIEFPSRRSSQFFRYIPEEDRVDKELHDRCSD